MAEKYPGKLMQMTLNKMHSYLHLKGVGGNQEKGLIPVVTTYMTGVLQPACGSNLSMRNARELLTIAKAVDLIIVGKLSEACDVLLQRFKSVETAATEGSWGLSTHLELLPEMRVSSLGTGERSVAMAAERHDAKLRKEIGAKAAPIPRGS
eukprot:6475188-Amphidinium_carterae.1